MNCEVECIHGNKCIIGPPNHQVHHMPDDCYRFPYPEWDFSLREPKFNRIDD